MCSFPSVVVLSHIRIISMLLIDTYGEITVWEVITQAVMGM